MHSKINIIKPEPEPTVEFQSLDIGDWFMFTGWKEPLIKIESVAFTSSKGGGYHTTIKPASPVVLCRVVDICVTI